MSEPVRETSSRTLPALPLPDGVVLPQMVLTIALETSAAKAAAEAAGERGELVLVPRIDGRYGSVGVIAHIEDRGSLPNGSAALFVKADGRARIGTGVAGTGDALWLQVEPIPEEPPSERAQELAREY